MSKNCSSNQVESDESDHVDWMNAAKLDRRFERFKQKDGSHIESLLMTALEMAVSKSEEHFGTIREQGKVNHGIYGESTSGGRHGLRLCENEKR
jgi:hypothetical protein